MALRAINGNKFWRIVIRLRGWDNHYIFFVTGGYDEAIEKAWQVFRERELKGVLPEDAWYLGEVSSNAFFDKQGDDFLAWIVVPPIPPYT